MVCLQLVERSVVVANHSRSMYPRSPVELNTASMCRTWYGPTHTAVTVGSPVLLGSVEASHSIRTSGGHWMLSSGGVTVTVTVPFMAFAHCAAVTARTE